MGEERAKLEGASSVFRFLLLGLVSKPRILRILETFLRRLKNG
jgi:hypothetical protein